jgi:hypothetical protein
MELRAGQNPDAILGDLESHTLWGGDYLSMMAAGSEMQRLNTSG